MSYVPLTAPDVSFDADGHFRNVSYDDVYHSTQGALGQAEYVFVRGNGLPERWRGRRSFTVCETGFGVGLNFLALWNTWRNDAGRPARLHMLSIEAHPFSRDSLEQALRRVVPDPLRKIAEQLVAQWPPCLPGLHRLEFEGGAVTLTLAFGRAAVVAPRLRAIVDAYFFDGFAPARNPDAWEPTLLRVLAKLAAPDATLATWASSGPVRAALSEAGFDVRRQPGYAQKWHMTVGVRSQTANYMGTRSAKFIRRGALNDAAWVQACDADRAGAGEVIVIGAGLAGAGIAQALAIRGRSVVVIDTALLPTEMTHASHVAAALTPVIARDDNARARLARAGSARALARWAGLPSPAAPLRCGTVQLERDAGRMASLEETLQQLQFPESWVRRVDRDEASQLAGIPLARDGIFFSDGLLVQPGELISALLKTSGVRYLAGHAATLQRVGDIWQVKNADGQQLAQAATVIVANAMGAQALLEQSGLLEPLPRFAKMYRVAGQVCLLPEQQLAGGPHCIVGGEGYLLPAIQGQCVAGSTYENDAQSAQISVLGQREILDKVGGLVDGGLVAQAPSSLLPGWAGWRAVLPGQVPAVGPLFHAPGVWMAAGYASRGLSWSALSGDIIASALCAEPLPLETDLLAAVAPR